MRGRGKKIEITGMHGGGKGREGEEYLFVSNICVCLFFFVYHGEILLTNISTDSASIYMVIILSFTSGFLFHWI